MIQEDPYITGNPLQLKDSDLFVGRADLYQMIQAALHTPHGKPTLALYGARRMGKTTVLLNLPRQLDEPIVPVFIDLQGAQASSEGGFYWEIARAMQRQCLFHQFVGGCRFGGVANLGPNCPTTPFFHRLARHADATRTAGHY
jgi:hypothetical protein